MSDRSSFARDVTAMIAHLRAVDDPLYRASGFWTYFNELNTKQLEEFGFENCKRSTNQNYFNWIPLSTDDNQFRNVARYWGEHPAADVLDVRIDEQNDITNIYGNNELAKPELRQLYRAYVGLLWHYTRRVCPAALTDTLSEPTLGNPIRTTLAGRLISQDLANSIRERTTALSPLENELAAGRFVSIVEIGAGYGRLGYVALASAPCRYTIVDIPPALGLSQWYLTTLFPQKSTFRFRPWTDFAEVAAELDTAEISFMTPDQFALCPAGYFDVGITISTLPEMSRAQFAFYLSRLSTAVSRVVYTKQWLEHHNTQDDFKFRRADFVLPRPWRLRVDRVDAVQNAFFERLWVRDDPARARGTGSRTGAWSPLRWIGRAGS